MTNPGSRITAIGCAKWGGVKDRHKLILVDFETEVFPSEENEIIV